MFNNTQFINSTKLTSDYKNKHYCSQTVLKLMNSHLTTIFNFFTQYFKNYLQIELSKVDSKYNHVQNKFINKQLVITSFGTYLFILKSTDREIEHLELKCY